MFLRAFESAPPKMQAHFCDQVAVKTDSHLLNDTVVKVL